MHFSWGEEYGINTSDMNLNFKSFGQGPALIILHGLFGSLDNWVSQANQLADSFSVFLIDQRNHGRSPHGEPWNPEQMAEDLAEFMDQQGIMQAHLLGHSMGGKTVMKFAGLYPYQIDRLIVVDMAPRAYEPHHQEIIAALNAVQIDQIQSREEAEEQLKPSISDWGVRQFLLKGLTRNGKDGFKWKFNLPLISRDYLNILEKVELDAPFEGPTLFVSGEKSNYVRPADHPEILTQLPAAEFSVIPQAGHWVHAEAPEAFLAEVRRFLL
jgi:pimeloyl-ACP methyl ester carboxylesterase